MNAYYPYRHVWRFNGAPHEESVLSKQQRKDLLKQGGLMIRNTYSFDCQKKTSFWYVIKDHFGGMDELSSNTRRKVKRSLERLAFRKVDSKLLSISGYAILKATFDDHAITDRIMNAKTFKNYLLSCEQKNYEYWGVFDKTSDVFIGFSTIWLWADACEIGKIAILPTYKRQSNAYPYYGLFYSLCHHYLQENGLNYISDGSRSVTEHSNVHQFLEDKFNFRKAFCQLEVHYCWWMKIAVKMLYPFRKIIPLPRVKAILNMEAMQRGEK